MVKMLEDERQRRRYRRTRTRSENKVIDGINEEGIKVMMRARQVRQTGKREEEERRESEVESEGERKR